MHSDSLLTTGLSCRVMQEGWGLIFCAGFPRLGGGIALLSFPEGGVYLRIPA